MKMMNQMKQFKHNSFSAREPELRMAFETQKDFGLAKYSLLLYSIKKTNPGNFYSRNEKEKLKNNSEKVIMRKLRIFKVKSAFDSITFSKDFLDSVEDVLVAFDRISNNQMFGILDEKYYQTGNVEFKLPHWFKHTSLHSFSSWVVAHFEKRIYLCYKEGESAYENKMPIQLREDYLGVWTSLDEERKQEIITKVVDQIDHYRQEAFGPTELMPNYKESKGHKSHKMRDSKNQSIIRNMHWDEIMFKLIWMMNKDMYDWKDLPREVLKEKIRNKITRTSQNGTSSFVYGCVAPNLVDSMKIERYFMNLMVKYLHDLYIQKNIDDLMMEEEQKGKGKKKNKKKKKKKRNKKRKQNQKKTEEIVEELKPQKLEEKQEKKKETQKPKEEEVTIELVEQETLSRGNRDEFMMKLRRKIQKEGDKKGLLVPLLQEEEGGDRKEVQKVETVDTNVVEIEQIDLKKEKKQEIKLDFGKEKLKSRTEKAVLLCERIHQIFMKKNKKKNKINMKDTNSLCGKQEKKEIEESNTVEEGSDHLYQSVRTTGMEAFWDDSKGTNREGDSFFLLKTHMSTKDPQSDKVLGPSSKGGFSFGCRSQSRRERFTEDCKSEGSKVLSRKINSVGKSLLEIDDLKIEEDIEQEKELVSSEFEIVVPLKPVKIKETKEKQKEEKIVNKGENNQHKGKSKSKKNQRKKTKTKDKNYPKKEEIIPKPRVIEVKDKVREESPEPTDPIIFLHNKKKSRKSRSLCEMIEKKEKKEMDNIEKMEKKKKKRLKYKLKKSKKDRKRKNEKKNETKQETEIISRKKDQNTNNKKPLVIQRKGYPKKEQTKEPTKKQIISKEKGSVRTKMQKWEESEPEEKGPLKKPLKKVTKEKISKATTQKKKKVEKKTKPFKPGKWNQQEKSPLHMVKKKKGLQSKSNAFFPGSKKRTKVIQRPQMPNASFPIGQTYTTQMNPMPYPFMNQPGVMNQQSIKSGALSYQHVNTEVEWTGNFNMHSVKQTTKNMTLQTSHIESMKSESPLIKDRLKSHEEIPQDSKKRGTLTKSQEFFSKREIPNQNFKQQEQESFSAKTQTNTDVKQTQNQKLWKLINDQKQQINKLTKEAFTEFVGESVKKIISDLKSQAEVLNNHRQIILNRINSIVHKSFKTTDVNVCPYGSFDTGLLTPYSDLDLAISFNSFTTFTLEEKRNFLDTLENNLRLFSFVKESKKVLTATVPVIKIKADASIEYPNAPERAPESRIIKVDIIMGSYEENGDMSPAFRTTDFVKKCITFYPSFFDIVLFFKFALASNKLSNAFSGGLNAYGLSILYVSFLVGNSLENCTDIGFLTLEFLKFLTYSFDPTMIGVRLNFNELTRRQPFVPLDTLKICAPLVILDPTSRVHKNVTPSCYKVFHVLNFLRNGFLIMQNACNFMEHKLLRKLEETLNRTVSKDNRIQIINIDSKNISKSQLSNSIPAHQFSLNNKTNNSLFLSNFNLSTPNLFPIPSEVLSQDIQKKPLNPSEVIELCQTPINREPAKSLKTKSEIKYTHSNTTSPQSKNEEMIKNPIDMDKETKTEIDTLKFQQRKGKEMNVQLGNITDFKICQKELLMFFKETYSDLMETNFKLNYHCREDVSNCESVVHEKLQTDMNFDAQRKNLTLSGTETRNQERVRRYPENKTRLGFKEDATNETER